LRSHLIAGATMAPPKRTSVREAQEAKYGPDVVQFAHSLLERVPTFTAPSRGACAMRAAFTVAHRRFPLLPAPAAVCMIAGHSVHYVTDRIACTRRPCAMWTDLAAGAPKGGVPPIVQPAQRGPVLSNIRNYVPGPFQIGWVTEFMSNAVVKAYQAEQHAAMVKARGAIATAQQETLPQAELQAAAAKAATVPHHADLAQYVQSAIDSGTRPTEVTVMPYGPCFWMGCDHPTCWACKADGLTSYFGPAGTYETLHEYYAPEGTGVVISVKMRCMGCRLETSSVHAKARAFAQRMACVPPPSDFGGPACRHRSWNNTQRM
jgi:hypothetical protein